MTFYPNERIGLFIDGANFYGAAKSLGVDIDYRRLLEEFRKRGRLVRAYYYTALVEEQDRFSPLRPLIDFLEYNGFTLVTKMAKTFTDQGTGYRRVRGDMDVELAVDILESATWLDHVILFSGDGDFRRVVEAVQAKGVRVSVVSSMKSDPPMISDDLRRQADSFIELADLARLISRDGPNRARAEAEAAAADADEDDDEDEFEDDDVDVDEPQRT